MPSAPCCRNAWGAEMLDLRPEWLEQIRALLAQHLPGIEVRAYGSRVMGTAHEASDLDLVARRPEDPQQTLEGLAELREAFSESRLPILVDIHDWARIPEGFRREIEACSQIVQPGQPQGPE